jgi:hypothetical protein
MIFCDLKEVYRFLIISKVRTLKVHMKDEISLKKDKNIYDAFGILIDVY